MEERERWRCFHCGAVFALSEADLAQEHFGEKENLLPLCKTRQADDETIRAIVDEVIGAWEDDDGARVQAFVLVQSILRGAGCEGEEETGVLRRFRDALLPFALMHRVGSDPEELACVRGASSDMTVLTSGDFENAFALLLDIGGEAFSARIEGDDRYHADEEG